MAQRLLWSGLPNQQMIWERIEWGLKMRDIIAELFAIAHSGKFTGYTQGVPVTLPDGRSVTLKFQRTSKSVRPVGLRFSKFAFTTEVTADHYRGVGYGEASTQLVALQKSIAEGVERALYQALKGTPYGSSNSNGWAAHVDSEKAFNTGRDELLERDAVLVHWLCQKPMIEVASSSWPQWLTRWTQDELRLSPRFNRLRILISNLGYLPTVTTVILDQDGHAVLSHATARSLKEALSKALAEACRIAQIAMENTSPEPSARLTGDNHGDSFHPEDHALFYAFHEQLPTWIFGRITDWKSAVTGWAAAQKKFKASTLNLKFHQVTQGPLVVGYCMSDRVQSLFFGRTQNAQTQGLLNVRRLKEVMCEGEFNLMPHWVP